jgi:hypothetical protein
MKYITRLLRIHSRGTWTPLPSSTGTSFKKLILIGCFVVFNRTFDFTKAIWPSIDIYASFDYSARAFPPCHNRSSPITEDASWLKPRSRSPPNR